MTTGPLRTIVVILVCAIGGFQTCLAAKNDVSVSASSPPVKDWTLTPTGLRYHIDKPGRGERIAQYEDLARIYFVGKVAATGEVFAQTPAHQPMSLQIGKSNILPGIQLGMVGMKVGETRRLYIPAKLGFGSVAHAKVPPHSDLILSLQLLDLKTPLRWTRTTQGHGAVTHPGDILTVHYTGKLADGTVFDSSHSRHEPFTFGLGSAGIIAGWNRGVLGMRVGETRKLVVPPYLGYGSQPQQNIPPDSTLYFEIQLLGIRPGVTWKTQKTGHGKTLRPGGIGKIHLQLFTLTGQTVLNTQFSKPITIGVNDQVDPRGLAIGIAGMKENEVRKITIPSQFAIQKASPFRNKPLDATVDLIQVLR